MKQSTSMITLLLLFSIVLVSIHQVDVVKAESTIYVRADGTVEGTDKIQREGIVYTFTDNIVNQSIMVEKDNIVVDGAGCTLRGKTNGIALVDRDNVTIKNFVISIDNFGWTSIYLQN